MFTGSLVADLLLGDVRSLKEKRSVVRPIVAELRRRYTVAAVGADAARVTELLDACERLIADRPEVRLLAVRRQLFSDTDD